MERRRLGTSALDVAPLALGASVFGWTVAEPTAFALMDRFIDEGFNLIDTADVYYLWAPGNSGGESETIIGNWLQARGARNKVVLATKVGEAMAPDRRGLSRSHIVASLEASLRRLRTDHIDLYQAHIDDPATPLEETLAAFDTLIRDGKVRAVGASNYEPARLSAALEASRACGLARFESFQTLYNLCDRQPFETAFLPVCQDEALGVLTYRSLARGFLTGKYRSQADQDASPRGADAIAYLDGRGRRVLDALDSVAAEAGASPAQAALAWLMTQPGVSSVIASASGPEQLHDLMGAARLQLSREAIDRLTGASGYP